MSSKRLKTGIIGCGTIGLEIAKACETALKDKFELFAICDIDAAKAASLNGRLKNKVPVLKCDELIEKSDVVVEAASAAVSANVLEKCVRKKKTCLIMSVGGLIGKEALLASAGKKGVGVYIPSGAICGVDGLKSARSGRIETVTLTTRKAPKGLAGAPFLLEKGIDLAGLKEEKVVFEGDVLQAVKGFPQNINVSAILSLAGIGADKTRVRIIAVPGLERNIHEVEIVGDFGRITTRTENVPSKANPKTSQMAVLSAISTLGSIANSIKIGT
jgi:aspartate dehydrogenase